MLFTSLLTVGFHSCEPCQGLEGAYFDVKGITLENFRQDSPNRASRVDNNGEVDFKDYKLNINFLVDYVSKQKNSGGLINAAYADCLDSGYMGSKEYMAAMFFVTDQEYDALHQAGDTLNDIINFPAFIQADSSRLPYSLFSITLKTKPRTNLPRTFTVHYYQTNGEHYTATTPMVRIN